ncbi:MAG: cation transporter [Planctomycetota bacterium]|jgi:predicted Co/Zn/Cd cation transporter (cation efflux family)|nr:cation transporter [Planctomycetota bacterium]
MGMTDRQESRVLLRSVIANAVMGVAGLVGALMSGSTAVLMDSAFSWVAFGTALLSCWATTVVARPSNERFPLGYTQFEPWVNAINAIKASGFVVGADGRWYGDNDHACWGP